MRILRRMHRSAARKGVSAAGGYFMGYYTIWLAAVKRYFVPFWELGRDIRTTVSQIQNPHPETHRDAARVVGFSEQVGQCIRSRRYMESCYAVIVSYMDESS